MAKVSLSVIIPLYNERENISPLHKELKGVLAKLGIKHEIIFVDDGSTDGSYMELKRMHNKHKSAKVIKFRRNFGQSAAINAGFLAASGDFIVVMDADLQNDPRDIPKLLDKLREGNDVVSGWRFDRNDSFSKKIFSKISNWMHKKLTKLEIHDSGCTLKAYTKESVKGMNLFGEMHRFIPALIAARGFSIAEVKVNHRERRHGKTKYGMTRLIHGFLDLIYIKFWTKYSTRPLHFFGYIGIAPIIMGLVIGVAKMINIIFLFLNNEPIFVSPLLLFSVFLIIIGVIFIMFGFLAEMYLRTGGSRQDYAIEKILS